MCEFLELSKAPKSVKSKCRGGRGRPRQRWIAASRTSRGRSDCQARRLLSTPQNKIILLKKIYGMTKTYKTVRTTVISECGRFRLIYYIKLQCPCVCVRACVRDVQTDTVPSPYFRHDGRTATKFGTHHIIMRIDLEMIRI